jgi:hypothetical protein
MYQSYQHIYTFEKSLLVSLSWQKLESIASTKFADQWNLDALNNHVISPPFFHVQLSLLYSASWKHSNGRMPRTSSRRSRRRREPRWKQKEKRRRQEVRISRPGHRSQESRTDDLLSKLDTYFINSLTNNSAAEDSFTVPQPCGNWRLGREAQYRKTLYQCDS